MLSSSLYSDIIFDLGSYKQKSPDSYLAPIFAIIRHEKDIRSVIVEDSISDGLRGRHKGQGDECIVESLSMILPRLTSLQSFM